MTCYAQRRATHLQQRIQEFKPKAVIFYSVNPAYISWWKSIAGVEFNEQFIVGDRMYIGKNKQTVFAIVRHPVSRGVENEYFHQVGKIISSILGFGDISKFHPATESKHDERYPPSSSSRSK